MKLYKKHSSKAILSVSTLALSIACIGVSTSAFAEDVKSVANASDNADVIIVTATGRSKQVQDIPVALTAVTAQTIQQAGISDIRNLQQVAPSYRVQTGQSNAASVQIAIRGIGTGSDNPGYESAVGVFIDGVYRNRSGVALTDLPKVDRVEILRGPQGTLFGRNTSAGAVSIVTAKPQFEANTYGKMELGNFGFINTQLGHTDAISDKTAYRLEGGVSYRNGLLQEVNTGKDINNRNRWFVRGQTLTNFSDDLSLRLIGDMAKTDELCCSAVRVKSGNFAPAIQTIAGLHGWVGIPPINEDASQVANTPGRDLTEKVDEQGVSGEVNWNSKWGKFTSITSVRKWELLRGQDVDFSGLDRAYRDNYNLNFDTFTQEFRLNGQKGKLDWLVGAFYMKEKTKFNDSVKYGADAARYVDAIASGVSIPWNTANGVANPCTGTQNVVAAGSTIYGSLGGNNSVLSQALCPTLVGQLMLQPGMTLPVAITNARAISNAYGLAVRNTAPVAGEGQQREYSDVDANSLAFFTHNIYDLSEKDKITVGLRYNIDKKTVDSDFNANTSSCAALQSTTNIGGGVTFAQLTAGLQATSAGAILSLLCNPILNTVANGQYHAKKDEEAWNGTFSYSHDISDDLMLYGTYSRGYKSGGFNYDRSAFKITPASTTRPSVSDWLVAPEFTDNYEMGWKWSGLPGRLTFNGAIFYEAISDYQMNAWTGFNFRSFNVDKMVSKGIEFDLVARPITGLTLTGGALFNKATLESDIILPTSAQPNGEIVLASGSKLANAPEITLTAALNYKKPIENTSLAWSFYVDGKYQSDMVVQTLFRNPVTDQKAYSLFNTRFGIGSQNGTWALEGWVRNIGDITYHQYSLGIPEQTYTNTTTGLTEGEYANYKSEPRTYGVTLRADF